jgi:WD40 repeat protein
VREIDAGKVSLLSCAYSPDGAHLASTGHGGEADIWDAETGDHERSLLGHSQPVPQASWSHDGELIATCSSDGSTRVWDAHTGKEVLQIRQRIEVMEVAWSRDDRRLYTTSTQGGIAMWPVPRETRSVEELEAFTAAHTPYRLVDGQLESVESRR